MPWDKGFNFRATAVFVTDGTDETYDIGTVYPVTRNGATFGWAEASEGDARDRDALVDRRLAGIMNRDNVETAKTWRLDLPATGDFTIRLAAGDTEFSRIEDLELLDDNTVFATVADNVSVAQDNYLDATGVTRTEANWPSQNATLSRTFTSTILRVRIAGLSAPSGSSGIAHVFVSQVAAAEGPSATIPASPLVGNLRW